MKSLFDYGYKDPMIRKTDSPDFFKFSKKRKTKTIEYFSPLKTTTQYFPDAKD